MRPIKSVPPVLPQLRSKSSDKKGAAGRERLHKEAVYRKRFPTGWGGVGVVHTEEGGYFTSVALKCENASVLLCIETGAMCEAQKFNEKITHCLCVVRDDEKSPYKVLSPWGVCQERLRY